MSDSRDFAPIVRSGYDRIVEAYLAQRRADTPDIELLHDFVERLAPGSSVLDAGCGAGVPVAQLLSEKFRVTGVDFSPAQIARARALVPAARFLCADPRTVEFPHAHFDAICSYYTIIHVPRDDHATLLARLARFLKPGGVALLCLGAQDLPYDQTDDYLGAAMVWSHFDAATNRHLVEASGLRIEWTREIGDLPPGGSHIFVLATRIP